MRQLVAALRLFVLAVLVASCGGGGGGGSSGATNALTFSPTTLSGNITQGTSATLTVRATAVDPIIFSRTVYVFIEDNAGLLMPSVELTMVDFTTLSATLHTSPSLATGRYQGSFQIHVCADAQCTSEHSGSPDALPYDITVTDVPFQAVPNTSTATTTYFGGTPDPVQVSVSGPSLAWTATTSAGWLNINGGSGNGSGTFTVSFTTSALSEGTYEDVVTVRSSDGQSVVIPFSVSIQPFVPVLSAPTTMLSFGGSRGHDLGTPQTLAVSLNTGATAWPYQVTNVPSWLSVTPATGSVSQSGATLSFVPVSANVTPGASAATVSIVATVDGEVVTLPITVNLNADQHRMLASEWGVGMASAPAGNMLSRTISITDNFGGTLNWTSSVDVPWLTVTGAGDTSSANNLSLSADPTTLPTDTVSYANVTVSASAAGIEPAIVRVALWKSTTGIAVVTSLSQSYTRVVADAVRPYVYVHNGGTDIDVFNVHTAQKIGSIAGVGGALGQMSVSPDGQHLFALDTATPNMAVISLDTQTKTADWTLDTPVTQYTPILAIRPNGVEVVFVGNQAAYANGRSLGSGVGTIKVLAATSDGKQVFAVDGAARFDVDYSSMSGGTLFLALTGSINIVSGGNLQDFAVDRTGTRAYSASGGGTNGGYKCGSYDVASGSFISALPGGDAYPNNVEVTFDGRAICGISGWYSTYDIWVHSPTGTLLQGYKFAGYARELLPRQMVVSPDGLVVVGLTDDPRIAFVPIGAP